MASANELQIKVIVDAAQLNSAMPQAAAVVNDAATNMAAAMIRAKSASVELNQTLSTLAKKGLQPTAEQTEEVAAAMFEAESATLALKAAQQEAYGTTERLTTNFVRNQQAVSLLGAELGVRIPRAMESVAAHSQLLGPAISAAFSGIVLIGFVEILLKIPDAIKKITDNLAGWSKAAQDFYADSIKANERMIEDSIRLKIQVLELNEVGTKGSQKYALAAKDVTAETQLWAGRSRELHDQIKALNAQLAETVKITVQVGRGVFKQQEVLKVDPGSKEYDTIITKLKETQDKADIVAQTLRELGQVKGPRILKEDMAALAEEAKKAAEAAAKSNEEFTVKMAELAKKREDLLLKEKLLVAESAEFRLKDQSREIEEAAKAAEQIAEAERKFQGDRLQDAEELSVAKIRSEELAVEEQLRLGLISNEQARVLLNKLVADKLAIELKYIKDRETVILQRMKTDDAKAYAEDLAEWSKLLRQKQQAQIEADSAIQKNTDMTQTAMHKAWVGAFKSIGTGLDQMIHGILQGTQTIGQAFARLGRDMLVMMVSALAKILLQHAITYLLVNVLHKKQLAEELGLVTAGSAKKAAVIAATNVGTVVSNAAAAGAATFASVMEALPFPTNIATAPEVTAGVVSDILGFLPAASAAGGWDLVPADNTLAMLHKNETVLPAYLAERYRAGAPGADGASGGVHVHFSYAPQVHAIDSRGMKEALKGHGGTIVELLRREAREFRL